MRVSAVAGGGWDIAFVGALAGRDIQSLRFTEVQTLDLRLADGRVADTLRLRLAGGTDWATTALDLRGRAVAEFQGLLQAAVVTLPGLGAGQVRVDATDTAGVFHLVADQTLAGADLPTVVAGLTRHVEQAPAYLLIGAADVQATFGTAAAGVQVIDGGLGLVLSRGTAVGQTGYALVGEGTATLQGFNGAVTLNAASRVMVNTLGRAVDIAVPTGLTSAPRQVTFTDGTAVQELVIRHGQVTVAELGTLSGDLAVRVIQHKVSGLDTTDIRIGLAEVSGSLQAGGASATLTNGAGAILLRDQAGIGSVYAVQAEGDVAFDIGSAVTLQADRLKVTLNRWGEDLAESVATATGRYDINLVKDEARLRGTMTASIAQALTVSGELFIELAPAQTVQLSDGSSVRVQQLTLGGANLSALLDTGNPLLSASLTDSDVLAVISTEVGGSGRRWLSVTGNVGGATVAGYSLDALTHAGVNINRAIGSVSGAVAAANAAVVNWSANARTVRVDEVTDLLLDMAGAEMRLPIEGELRLGDAVLAGQFEVVLTQTAAGRQWTIQVEDAGLGFDVAGARVSLSHGSGTLVIAPDGTRSGTVAGEVALTGLDGLTLGGQMQASFDAQGRLSLVGEASLDVMGLATLSGQFAVDRTVVDHVPQIRIAASGLSAFVGVGDVGASLSNGQLTVLIGTSATTGLRGYSMQGQATAIVATPVVSMTGQVRLVGDTLGENPVSPRVDLGELDALLTDRLGGAVASVADSVSDLKRAISPDFDAGGTNTNTHPMAVELPIIGRSLSQLSGMDRLLGLGDYVSRYLGEATGSATGLPVPNWGATGQPTLRGLLGYLQTQWLPTLGVSADALQVVMGRTGLEIAFADTLHLSSTTAIQFGAEAEALGLKLDGDLNVNVSADLDVALRLQIDWQAGTSRFVLERLNIAVQASVQDIDITGSLGPLAVSLGDASRQTGSLSLQLAGSVQQTATGLSFIKTVDALSVNLPVYAQLGSLDLAAGAIPTIVITGQPFDGKVSLSTVHFDQIGDFSRMSVVDLIQMFPDFIQALETVRDDGRLAAAIPFLDAGLDQVLTFGQGFKESVYDRIDFNRPRVDLMSLGSVTVVQVTAGSKQETVLVNPFGGFDATLLKNAQVTLYRTESGRDVEVGTYGVQRVVNGSSLVLSGSPAVGVGLKAVVHEKREQITTLQEFMAAVNASGVLPAGLQIVFDPVQRSFGVPLQFRQSYTPVDMPLNFDFGIDGLTLSTLSHGNLTAYIEGQVTLFADLDGRTLQGRAGSITAGSNLFSDSTFAFDSTMLGYKLELDGQAYTVVGIRGAHTVALDHAATTAATTLGYTLRQDKFQLGIENVSLKGGIVFDARDLEVAVQLGFLGATAGGVGTGSGVHVAATAEVSLDRQPGSNNPDDRRFTFSEIGGSALRFTLDGEAEARLRGLRVNAGVGSDIPLAPNIEISVQALDLFHPGAVKVIHQNPMYAANVEALVLSGSVKPNAIVVVMPDLGAAFDFRKLSFEDIVEATRQGLEFIRSSIEDQPFYSVVLPVVGRSLADVFPFVDGFLAQIESAAPTRPPRSAKSRRSSSAPSASPTTTASPPKIRCSRCRCTATCSTSTSTWRRCSPNASASASTCSSSPPSPGRAGWRAWTSWTGWPT